MVLAEVHDVFAATVSAGLATQVGERLLAVTVPIERLATLIKEGAERKPCEKPPKTRNARTRLMILRTPMVPITARFEY